MCGITGHVGARESLPIIADSLENLEYRGYDSAGVAIAEDGLAVYKRVGEIGDLDLPESTDATLGIGHTRWSTHGEPNDANAHPHTDCSGEIAVVHNGIIDNYESLKADLGDHHEFTSATDTEVVAHLLEAELDGETDLREAFTAVVSRLEGSFALAAITADAAGIVAARQDSPLVVGRGDGETFLASDVPAFVEHTRDVVYLDDGDVAWLTPETVQVWNDGAAVERETDHVDWEADAAEKGGYDHYMLKEIHEQPRALRQALSGRVDEVAGEVTIEHSLSEEYLDSLDEIQFVAAGTSYHAGVFAARLFEDLADVRATTHLASEYEFTGGRDPWRTLAIAVTQSGETADTLSAIRAAKSAGATTLAVTNTVGSTVTRETDDTVLIQAGPEIGVAATKTFVSQVATLAMLAVQFGRTRGTLARGEARDLLENVRGLPGAIQRVLDREDDIEEQAVEYADSEAFFFIGRHLGHAVALEAALKLKEISYDHAEGFAAGELKHGPLALVTDEATVLSVLTTGARPAETVHNVKEVDSRRANTLGVTTRDDIEGILDASFEIPELGRMEPLVANVYFQLFAYHVADQKGRPIDKPRNLAKSVTVK